MPKILAASGFNKIWAAPKQASGRLSDDYRVLWLPAHVDDLQKANAFAAQLSGTMGLIRGKSTFGVRMLKSAFDTAWTQTYPEQSPPKDIPSTFVYKLEPLVFMVPIPRHWRNGPITSDGFSAHSNLQVPELG